MSISGIFPLKRKTNLKINLKKSCQNILITNKVVWYFSPDNLLCLLSWLINHHFPLAVYIRPANYRIYVTLEVKSTVIETVENFCGCLEKNVLYVNGKFNIYFKNI